MNVPRTNYYLPRATASLLNDERIKQCKNLGLLLNKYMPQAAIQNSAQKGRWLRDIVSRNTIDAHLAMHSYRRWLSMTTVAGAQHFRAATDWRLLVGLSSETVLETGLTLHSLYGLPLIRGSALKGLCRAYVTGEIAEHASKDIDDDDETVKRIFGSETQSGTVIFFDAIPFEGKAAFELDIVNVHYPDYYTTGKAPGNDQRPNPVTFLTVSATLFVFALAPRNIKREEQKDDVTTASNWLREAIQEYGVGGKTSSGYGYLTPQ